MNDAPDTPGRNTAKALFRGSCAVSALVVALAAQPVRAQQMPGMIVENVPHMTGDMIVANQPQISGSLIAVNQAQSAIASGPGFTLGTGSYAPGTVTVTSSEAILDWSLNGAIADGETTFLAAGDRLTFVGTASQTVLNRLNHVSASDPRVRIDGQVTSGPTLWFYTPGGFVIGAGAVFDVGGLILTSLPVDTDGDTRLFGPGGEIRFGRAPVAGSSIVIEENSNLSSPNILADGNGSYVALVAPRIEQHGVVDVNGSVAYVAAEQAEMSIDNGLFDINVSIGSGDANGVVHSGTTTGDAASTGSAPRAIYMVAVPKNTAITMLVGGDIGYRPASSAAIENGTIVLSAGADVSVGGDAGNSAPVFDRPSTLSSPADIVFTGGTFGGNMAALATGTIDAMASNGEQIVVGDAAHAYDIDLEAYRGIDLGGLFGGSFQSWGDVSLTSGSSSSIGSVNLTTGLSAFGDTGALSQFAILSSAGTIDIAGTLTIDVSSDANSGGTGIGGTVTFNVPSGSITAETIDIYADGTGGPSGSGSHMLALASQPTLFALSPIAPVAMADGVDGVGGIVTFDLTMGNLTVANLSVSANGFGGNGTDGDSMAGTVSGNGGSGTGGTATFNAIAGTLTVTNQLTVAANGTGGAGGNGTGVDGGNGGAGIGGTAVFNLDGTATINGNVILVQANGSGGVGGDSDIGAAAAPAGRGGDGGTGTGGIATFTNTAGTISFATFTVQALGTGASGGTSIQQSGGTVFDAGGNGGDAVGGTATINLNQDDPSVPAYTVSADATGGSGGGGLTGGGGGNATGGTAVLNVDNAAVDLTYSAITATGTGGAGGTGLGFTAPGGDGGNGTGGTARLEVVNVDGMVDISGTAFVIDSSGTGGTGGTGSYYFNYDGGSGGNGGDGTGGYTEIYARTGGTIDISTIYAFDFASTGTGGAGGTGGNAYNGTGGDGGDGGMGTGGTAHLLAQGGTITTNDVNILITGSAGTGGAGGTYGLSGVNGADGLEGTGAGGTGIVEVQEGSPGIITAGAVIIQANGLDSIGAVSPYAYGGTVIIADTSTDPLGLITFSSLDITANTVPGTPGSGVFISSNSGPITVAGAATISAGDNVEFAFEDDGQFVVGSMLDVTSLSSILVSHINRPGGIDSINVIEDAAFTAGIEFNAMAGSRIVSETTQILIRANENASADNLQAFSFIDVSAGRDALVNDAAVIGPPLVVNIGVTSIVVSGINIEAGSDGAATPTFSPNYSATITGDVTSTGVITVSAGANAFFMPGSTSIADDRLTVRTGDDIVIGSGATVAASANPFVAPNPASPFTDFTNLSLLAGDITFASGELDAPILTPISSIVSAGAIDSNSSAVIISAQAIDGTGGTIMGSSLSADINNAPPNGAAQSDDNGRLSAACVEGNACLGSLFFDNIVAIGQTGVPIDLIVEGGTVAAADVLVTTRAGMIIGTDGADSSFSASNQVVVESQEGDIDLRDATLNGLALQVTAAGSLLGTGNLISANDVGITVGQDLFATSIVAGGQLTDAANIGGALEAQYSLPGSIGVGTLTIGTGNADIVAGADITLGLVNLSGGTSSIVLLASGDAFLGANTGTFQIDIQGHNVGFGDIVATDSIALLATVGNISGTSANAGTSLDMDAALAIGFDTAVAGTSITAGAGSAISFASVSAGGNDVDMTAGTTILGTAVAAGADVFLTAAGDVETDTIIAGGNTELRSASGAVIVNTDIAAGGTVLASGGAVLLNALGGLTVSDARATNGDIDIFAAGDLVVSQALSVGDINLASTGGSVTAGDLVAGAATVAPAIASTTPLPGNLVPQGRIVGSPGVGDITITAATDAIIIRDAFANNLLLITAGGLIDLQAIATGASITTTSADFDIAAGGQLGTSDLTQDIFIQSNGASQMVLGGTGTAGAFSLSSDEFSRIFSGGDLTLFAVDPGGAGPGMVVEDLFALVATGAGGTQDGNIGVNGTLLLASEGLLRVNGELTLFGATANNALSLLSDTGIRVDASTANIAVIDANDAFGGTLLLTAPFLLVATDAAAADIAGATVAAIDTRLADSDGIDRDDGFLQAGGITITVTGGAYIQNSVAGTDYADRRGFVVGDGGIAVVNGGTGSIGIVINGVQRGTNTVTGADLIAQTAITGAFDSASTINGCLIVSPVTCLADGFDDFGDPHDLIEEEIKDDGEDGRPVAPLVETLEIFPTREGPVVDDPVTGAGNDDLWLRSEPSGTQD